MKNYDVIVIGTGAANIVTDAALAQGLQVAVIERGRFGGTCLNRGCIPTKVMVTAAASAKSAKGAASASWLITSAWTGICYPSGCGKRSMKARPFKVITTSSPTSTPSTARRLLSTITQLPSP